MKSSEATLPSWRGSDSLNFQLDYSTRWPREDAEIESEGKTPVVPAAGRNNRIGLITGSLFGPPISFPSRSQLSLGSEDHDEV